MKVSASGMIIRDDNGRGRLKTRGEALDLSKFGAGEAVVVTVESEEEHRSDAQNRFFHGPILRAFMRDPNGDVQMHKQEAKDMLCLMFIPVDVRLPDGTIARCPGHTATLKKAEFTQFIDACLQLAAEQGMPVDDVDEWRKTQGRAA